MTKAVILFSLEIMSVLYLQISQFLIAYIFFTKSNVCKSNCDEKHYFTEDIKIYTSQEKNDFVIERTYGLTNDILECT